MNVFFKLHLIPSLIEGMILKPARRKMNKLRVRFFRAKQVRLRNNLINFGESKDIEVGNALKTLGFSCLSEALISSAEINSFVECAIDLTDDSGITSQEKKQFWQRPLSGVILNSDHFLVTLALKPDILSIVSEYIGGLPLLNSVEIIRSIESGENDWAKSQLWHRDHDDSRMLKLFIYLSDVSINNEGPFEYYDSVATNAMGLRYSPIHKTDKVVSAAAESKPNLVFGNKGTCFFVDTHRCLHRGSRMKGSSSRLVYIATYTSSCRLVSKAQTISVGGKADELTSAMLCPIDV